MKKLFLLLVFMSAIILVLFGLAMILEIPFLGDDDSIKELSGSLAFSIGSFLLAIDLLLPVPSSLIMITNGALFGIFFGTLASLFGSSLSMVFGWLLGKSGQSWVEKFMGAGGLEEAKSFFQKWGNLAIIVSRPVPVLAEAISIVCGSLNYDFKKTLLFGIIGLLPTCILYAYTGHLALEMESSTNSFLLVIGMAVLVWIIGMLFRKRAEKFKFQNKPK